MDDSNCSDDVFTADTRRLGGVFYLYLNHLGQTRK